MQNSQPKARRHTPWPQPPVSGCNVALDHLLVEEPESQWLRNDDICQLGDLHLLHLALPPLKQQWKELFQKNKPATTAQCIVNN